MPVNPDYMSLKLRNNKNDSDKHREIHLLAWENYICWWMTRFIEQCTAVQNGLNEKVNSGKRGNRRSPKRYAQMHLSAEVALAWLWL